MITRKQPQSNPNGYDSYDIKSSSVGMEESHQHNRTPLPDYEAKPTLTHDNNVDFFGDSITTERHGISRSSLDQEGLRRGSVTTLPSAGQNRRNSAHKRGVPISGTNNWPSDVNRSPQAKSAPAYADVPIGDDALHSQNLSSKPSQQDSSSSNAAKEENRKSSIADMASAAVLAGGTAVAGVAAAASVALLGTTTKPPHTQSTEHERMPSAWPTSAPSQSSEAAGGLDLSNRLAPQKDILKEDATTCNYEPAIHGQSACFHTKDPICDETTKDKNHAFCENVQEPSLHGQNPSFYGTQGESHHTDCVIRQAINNDRIIVQDFAGCHHKASPTDEELAVGTNAICDSKIINAHNFDFKQHVGSTHDKIDYNDAHGINSECITGNDLTDPHGDFVNCHPINQASDGVGSTTGFTGVHDSLGISSAAITSNDMTQPTSHHLATGAAIGAASALGAASGLVYTSNAMDDGQMPRAVTPPPSAAGVKDTSSQAYGPSAYSAVTSESNNISDVYRTDAQDTTSDMITSDHPRGEYAHNNVDDVYCTDAQGTVQNMITPENPTTSTAINNNDISDAYRTDAQGATQNMITAGNPTTNYMYNNVGDVYHTTPRGATPQSATPQYEPTPRASGEVNGERDRMSDQDHSNKAKGLLAGGGGIAAAIGGLLGIHHHQTHEKDKLNNEHATDLQTDDATRSTDPRANEPMVEKDLAGNTKDNNVFAAPTTNTTSSTGRNELNNATSRDISGIGQLHMDKLPLGNMIDQEPIHKTPSDNNAQPQQMHSNVNPQPMHSNVNPQSMPSNVPAQQLPTSNVHPQPILSKGGATTALVAPSMPENEHGTSIESFSSTRAITGTIVPDVRGQDEVKDRHDNFKNVVDSTDTSFRNNQEQKQSQQQRKNSFSQGFKTKAAAGTAAVASVFRRMSFTGGSASSGNKRNSIGKEHVRRLSDAEAFKNHTLANKDDGTTTNEDALATGASLAGTTGFSATSAINNVDSTNKDPGITNNGERLKYTGVQRDYARIPGVYSLNTSSGNANSNIDPVNGENNFVKLNNEQDASRSAQKEHRRGSIQVIVLSFKYLVIYVSQ